VIALDKNLISEEKLIESHKTFLIPYCALLEDLKTTSIQLNLKRTYVCFNKDSKKLFTSQSVPFMLRKEIEKGQPFANPIDYEATMNLRSLIDDNFNNVTNDYISKLITNTQSFISNQAIYRAQIQEYMTFFESTGEMKKLRHNSEAPSNPILRTELMLPSMIEITRKAILNPILLPNLSEVGRHKLCCPKSITFRFLFAICALAMKYVQGSPQLSVNPSKFLNDLLDIEYAVIGSYCDTLASNDTWTRSVYRMLRKAKCERYWRTGWKAMLLPFFYNNPL